MIGELYLPLERLVAFYGDASACSGVHLPFNFQLIGSPWQARAHRSAGRASTRPPCPTGGWPNWVLGNHDKPRIASRVGRAQARVAAMLLLTLRGTPTLYYGDEIGMTRRADPAGAQCRTRSRRTCRAWAWAAIRSARRCSGAADRRPASPPAPVAAPGGRLAQAQRRIAGA